jgi:hypothetical protein
LKERGSQRVSRRYESDPAAGVLADDVVIDLFADVVSGQMPAREAMAKAEKRIQRYYKV